MEPNNIIEKFESQDAHTILDGVWAILKCTDKETMLKLAPYIPAWKAKIKKINLGGMVYRNSDHFDLAMAYIKEICNGGCHCFVYQSTSLYSPESHGEKDFVSISNTIVDKEKYETCFDVKCNFCNKKFKVTEVMGWHVPWYKWEAQS
jgi:hypothetical protein